MNCKNCGYGLKQRCGDFEKIICTYEEGECVKIAELEQENAELKETITKMNNVITETFSKLTKAKELLEDLIRFQPYINKEAIFHSIGNEWKTAIYKAEQFIKDSEVEK